MNRIQVSEHKEIICVNPHEFYAAHQINRGDDIRKKASDLRIEEKKLSELEWSDIDSARYDEENSRYEFICNDELFDKNIIIGKYDMIKWSEATPLVTSVLCSVIEIIAEHI